MTAETSNARGEWVLVPREPSAGMLDSAENAMIESEWAYNAGKPDARSDAHGFPTMRIWQAVVAYRAMLAAAPPPPSAPVGVEGLVAKLRAVLCDPAGNVCIEGSDADRAEVQGALDALEALAKQPAAVDVAAAKRAVAAVMSAPDGISVEAFFRIVLEAALATKHQEPTTCKHDFRRDEDHGGACCQLCGEVRQ